MHTVRIILLWLCIMFEGDRGIYRLTLHWRHNERDGVSNYQLLDCLLNLCESADQRKHQSSVSLAFVRGIHW